MRLRSGHVLVSICVVGLTFVAVAIVMGTSVFTGNTTWEVGMPPLLAPKVHIEENMPAPVDSVTSQTHEEVKAQNSQGNAGNPLPSREPLLPNPYEDQSDALSYQSMEQLKVSREANKIAVRDNGIQGRLVTVGWITIGTQAVLTFVQFFFIRKANKHAEAAVIAAKESVEVADRGLRVANRAYLLMKDWKPLDLREDTKAVVQGVMYNAGRTPAILERQAGWCHIGAGRPQPLTPACLNGREYVGFPVNADGHNFVNRETPHIVGPVEYWALKEKTQFLYVSICFVYRDVFDERYWVVSSGVYDIGGRMFSVIQDTRYNCYGIYKEEDWANKNKK